MFQKDKEGDTYSHICAKVGLLGVAKKIIENTLKILVGRGAHQTVMSLAIDRNLGHNGS